MYHVSVNPSAFASPPLNSHPESSTKSYVDNSLYSAACADWAMRLKKEYSKKLGICLPVPRPLEAKPDWGYPGLTCCMWFRT
eukprot:2726857-Amphidinium_carterae.1